MPSGTDAAADALLAALVEVGRQPASASPSPPDSLRAPPSRVLLTGPVAPDGDSIGACLALQRILARRGVWTDVAGTPSYRYAWMPGADGMIADELLDPGRYRAVVVLDGDRHRLTPRAAEAFAAAELRGIVDHHGSTRPDGYTHAWLEPTTASTCTMLQAALSRWGEPLDRTLATLLYVGVVFDTGGFRYSNTTPEVHRMAAELLAQDIPHADICTRVLMERRVAGLRLAGHVFGHARFVLDGRLAIGAATLDLADRFGLADGDLEGVVDNLVHVVGVEVAALLVERADGRVKYSLRSRGLVDVARVAAELAPTGGGHAKAAGASVRASVSVAAELVTERVAAHLAAAGPSSD